MEHFPLLPGASAGCRAAFGGTEVWGALTPSSIPPSTQPVPPEGSHLLAAPRIQHSIETAFACLGACKSGAFQEFPGGASACGLSNPHSSCWLGLGAGEMFQCLLCCETVMATLSHPTPQGEQTTQPLLRGLGLVYFCFSIGKTHHCTVVIPEERRGGIGRTRSLPGPLTCSSESALLMLHLFPI